MADALPQPAQAEMSRARPVLREPHAIIADRHQQNARVGTQLDLHPGGMRVPYGVDESLLHDAVGSERDARAEIECQLVSQGEGHGWIPSLQVANESIQGLGEAQCVEGYRRQPRYEAVHRIVETCRLIRDEAGRILQRRLGRLADDGLREAADRRYRLAELIVQLVGDQAALFLQALLDHEGRSEE